MTHSPEYGAFQFSGSVTSNHLRLRVILQDVHETALGLYHNHANVRRLLADRRTNTVSRLFLCSLNRFLHSLFCQSARIKYATGYFCDKMTCVIRIRQRITLEMMNWVPTTGSSFLCCWRHPVNTVNNMTTRAGSWLIQHCDISTSGLKIILGSFYVASIPLKKIEIIAI